MKKFKKIFIHVGQDKTGSTSIQSNLHLNRELLAEYSYLYALGQFHPEFVSFFAKAPFSIGFNKEYSASSSIKSIKKRDAEYLSSLKKQLETAKEDYLIFSYEGFTNLNQDELLSLKHFLAQYTDQYQIIYYLRPPASYAQSALSQRVKSGSLSWHIHPPITPYQVQLTKLINVFGKNNINLRIFSKRFLKDGDVVIDFLNQIGCNQAIFETFKFAQIKNNISLSEEAIVIGDEIIRILNGYLPYGQDFRQKVTPTLEKIAGRKFNLSNLQIDIINKCTANDIKFIHDQFGYKLEPTYLDYLISSFRQISRQLIAKTQFCTTKTITEINKPFPAISSKTAHSIARILIQHLLPDFNLPAFIEPQQKNETIISSAKGVLECNKPEDFTMIPAEEKEFIVSITNHSSFIWQGNIIPVNASYHWLDEDKNTVIFDGLRSSLPSTGVHPSEKIETKILVKAPNNVGNYILELTLVQEYCEWFEKLGFTPQRINVCVK